MSLNEDVAKYAPIVGGLAGALIGTAIAPGVGTAAGMSIGGGLGSAAGTYAQQLEDERVAKQQEEEIRRQAGLDATNRLLGPYL